MLNITRFLRNTLIALFLSVGLVLAVDVDEDAFNPYTGAPDFTRSDSSLEEVISLTDLDDVNLASLANLNLLQYDSATSNWVNRTIAIILDDTYLKLDASNDPLTGSLEGTDLTFSGTGSFANLGIGTTNPVNDLDIRGDGVIRLGVVSGATSYIVSRNETGIGNDYRDLLLITNDFNINTATSDEGAGSAARFIIKHTTGNVGIGTANPNFKLTIKETGNAITGTNVDISNLGLIIAKEVNQNNQAVGIGFQSTTVTSTIGSAIIHERVGSASQGGLHFATKPDTGSDTDIPIRMSIDKDGDVGIGTTSPSVRLEVFDSVANQVVAKFFSGNEDGYRASIYVSDNNRGAFYVYDENDGGAGAYVDTWIGHASDETKALIVEGNTGNVGIGTASPATLLHLKESSAGAEDALIRLEGHGNDVAGTVLGALEFYNADLSGDGANVAGKIEAQSAGTTGWGSKLIFYVDDGSVEGDGTPGYEAMRIEYNGRVGIGTTDPTAPLHVKADTPTLMKLKRDSGADIQLEFNNNDAEVWTIGFDSSEDTFTIAASDDNFATNAYFNIERSNGNVGIGTAIPESGFHYYKDIDNSGDTFYADAANWVRIGNPNATAGIMAGILFDTQSGEDAFIYSKANANADVNLRLGVRTGTYGIIDALTIDKLGNVGIGTTTPDRPLEIAGAGELLHLDSTGDAILEIDRVSTSKIAVIEFETGHSRDWVLGTVDTGDIAGSAGDEFFIGLDRYTPKFWMEPTGNIGIGTTDPQVALDVDGLIQAQSTNNNDGYTLSNTDGNVRLTHSIGTSGQAQTIYQRADSTSMVQISASGASYFNGGNIGIGTMSPDAKLEVVGIILGDNYFQMRDTGETARNIITLGAVDDVTRLATGTGAVDHHVALTTRGIDRLFVEDDGNVGIGTTNPSEVLDVIGNVEFSGSLEPNADAGTSTEVLTSAGADSPPLWKTVTVDIPVALTMYDAEPARSSVTNVHGGLLKTNDAETLGPATPANDVSVSKGIGKIMIVINAGTDVSGTITVTGESIDRDTGASTGADTDTITVNALTTDGSDTDTNGNPRHSFTGAYITSKWFTGTVVLSTSTLNLSDIDVYHVSFEQYNDQTSITLNTFDANIFTTNVNAEFDAYLYALEVTGDKCDVSRQASLNVGADGETAIANKYWRLRRGNIAKALDGSTDGIWVDVHYSNSPAYVEDVTLKLWATKTQTLTLN